MFPRRGNQYNKNFCWPSMLLYYMPWTEHELRKLTAISVWDMHQFLHQKFASWKAAIKIPISFYSSFIFSHLRTISCLIYFPDFETDITQILTLWNIIKSFTSYSKFAKELVQHGIFPWCTVVLSEYNQFPILLHYNLY